MGAAEIPGIGKDRGTAADGTGIGTTTFIKGEHHGHNYFNG